MKKTLILAFVLIIATAAICAAAQNESSENESEIKKQGGIADMTKYIAAAVAIGTATVASGLAIGRIGSAAMGAVSERPEAGGTAIILAALAEGICLWGFLIAFFILQ